MCSTTGLVPIINIIINMYGNHAKNASLPVTASFLNPSSSLIKRLIAKIIKIIANKLDNIVGNSAPIVPAIIG